ncbi:MAG: hypothetical protein Q9160_000592 [Pyrenula sp. 1 TL-2023]
MRAQVTSEKQDLILKLEAVNCVVSTIDRNIGDMMSNLDSHSSASERQLTEIDVKIQELQQLLELSIRSRSAGDGSTSAKRVQNKARRRVSQQASRLELTGTKQVIQGKAPTVDFIRLVSPGILMREERGTTRSDLISLEMEKWNGLSKAQKLNMIRYLQGLRLLMWLLRWDNYISTHSTRSLSPIRSSLAIQAGVSSLWEFSNAFSDLATNLKAGSDTSLQLLPWLRYRAWLQYVFYRFLDRPREWEEVMELELKRWPSFPVPEDMFCIYVLPIPGRLVESQMSYTSSDWRDALVGELHQCRVACTPNYGTGKIAATPPFTRRLCAERKQLTPDFARCACGRYVINNARGSSQGLQLDTIGHTRNYCLP